MERLIDKLNKYCDDDYVPMHMPGHKRNTEMFVMGNPYGIDITEIDGFDNLQNADGILADSMEMAAKIYGADHTLYLVNGSSTGLMAAISAVSGLGSRIITARNSHRSVYNAICINDLMPVYLYPQHTDKLGINSQVLAEDVEILLKNNDDVAAVMITSPTYEGIISDVENIAKIAHKYGVPLIVDEAHGAHLCFHNAFPKAALDCGADIVIQSIHKTLPALTQTALLHVKGELVDFEKIKFYWGVFQSTSPSYVLLAGIDNCMRLMRDSADELFEKYIKELKKLREGISALNNIGLYDTDDISKVVLYIKEGHLNGKQFYDILLEKYHIQMEMASKHYVIAMTSVGDRKEYYVRFLDALSSIDKMIEGFSKKTESYSSVAGIPKAETAVRPSIALKSISEDIFFEEAMGKISNASVCVYPPGIPVISTGEVITEESIEYIRAAQETGLEVIGLSYKKKVDNNYNKTGYYIKCMK